METSLAKLFWHEGDGIWYDQLLSTAQRPPQPRRRFYASNFLPLETGQADAGQMADLANYARKSGESCVPSHFARCLETVSQPYTSPAQRPASSE